MVTVDPNSAEKSFDRTRPKFSAELCGFSASVNSGESFVRTQLVRSQVIDRMDDLYLLESPVLKILLFERTEHVNQLFTTRNTDNIVMLCNFLLEFEFNSATNFQFDIFIK